MKNTRKIADGALNDGSHPKLEGTLDLSDSIHKVARIVNRCSRCGDGNYNPFQCPFKSAKCHQCGKIGHIKGACRSRMSRPQESKPTQKKPISEVLPDSEEPISSVVSEEEHSDQLSKDECTLHQVASNSSKLLEVQVEINNKCVTVELDTGAAITIMSEKSYHSLFPGLQLDNSSVRLKSYSEQTILVVGQVDVAIKYDQQEKTLPLLVVQGDGHAVFGRNWLFEIRLN